jgi:large subunit ribosomal protein L19
MADLMASVEGKLLKSNAPELSPGDTVRVHAKVVEGNRERIQVFEGVVMRMRKGGAKADFTVRRISHGVGVERTFLVNSPRVDKVEVLRHGHVRRAQLYYLRGRVGRAARIRERKLTVKGAVEAAPVDASVETPTEQPAAEPVVETQE